MIMNARDSSESSRFVGLQRTLILVADLLAGKEVDRESAVRRTKLKPAAVDRQLRAIQKYVPGVVKVPSRRRLTLRFDKSKLEEAPSFPIAVAACLVRLDHILETPRMGVDGETGLQHKGQRPIQRTRSAWRRRQTCARVQCSVSVICALASVRFRPDRLFCMRRFF